MLATPSLFGLIVGEDGKQSRQELLARRGLTSSIDHCGIEIENGIEHRFPCCAFSELVKSHCLPILLINASHRTTLVRLVCFGDFSQ
jgi:hypothetical protein